MSGDGFTRELAFALGAPFREDEIDFLPRGSHDGKARAIPYVDARTVMTRLDQVVGPANWSFDFELLTPDGKRVKGKLTVLGVTKCDAGESGEEEEPLKAAISDALKRTAVHFGVGRYLYHLTAGWFPYDPRTRRFTETPRLNPTAVRQALVLCGFPGTELPRNRPAQPEPGEPAAARSESPSGARPAAARSSDGRAAPRVAESLAATEPPASIWSSNSGRRAAEHSSSARSSPAGRTPREER